MGITIDNTEIASQAFELIAPMYSDGMGNISCDELMMLNLISALDTYATSGFINTFESTVYSLTPEEITLEKLNSIAFEAAEAFGLDPYTVSMSWFEIQHLYIAPFYSVGYAISNDVSIQVLEKELENPGEGGVKAYLNVIERDTSLSFVDDIIRSDFKSPFDEGRVKEVADLIDLLIFSESKNYDNAESEPLESA
jgi:oligoendopeptidase F